MHEIFYIFKSIISFIISILPLIVIVVSWTSSIKKKQKKSVKEEDFNKNSLSGKFKSFIKEIEDEIAEEEKIEETLKKRQKSFKENKSEKDRKSIFKDLNEIYSEKGREELIQKSINKNKNDLKENKSFLENEYKEYNFKENTDDTRKRIAKERETIRAREMNRIEKNIINDPENFEFDEEFEGEDLVNAIIMKEILDKPLSIR